MRGVCAIVVAAVLLPAAVAFAYNRDDIYSGETSQGRGLAAEVRGNRVVLFEVEATVKCTDGTRIPWLVRLNKKRPLVEDRKWTLLQHPQQTPQWTVRATGSIGKHRKRMTGTLSVRRPAHNGVTCSTGRLTYDSHRTSSREL